MRSRCFLALTLACFVPGCSTDTFTTGDAATDSPADGPIGDGGSGDAGPCIAAPPQKLVGDGSCELATNTDGTLACEGANVCGACDPKRGEMCSYRDFADQRPPQCTTSTDIWIGLRWACDGRAGCGGAHCCIDLGPVVGTDCPRIDMTAPATICKSGCGPINDAGIGLYEACRNTAECEPSFKCVPVETNAGKFKRVVGICLKP